VNPANSVLAASIKSTATADVTDFELLIRSWVLPAGHHELITKYAAFVEDCVGTNLLYDGKTIAKPDFLGAVDCDILDTVYGDICDSGSCTLAQAPLAVNQTSQIPAIKHIYRQFKVNAPPI
jgi:hypothetical protein